jgi:methyl-accepting chemotaxis protein
MRLSALSNLSIRAKLAVGFAGAFALVLGIGGFALTQIRMVNGVTKEMREVWLPKIQAVDRIRAMAEEHRLLATRRLHNTNFRHLAKISRDMENMRTAVARAIDTYERLLSSGSERDLIGVFRAGWEFYGETLKTVEEQLEGGELTRAHSLFDNRTIPSFEQATYRLELLKGAIEEHTKQAELNAQAAYDLAVSVLTPLTVLAALAAFGATWWTSHSVTCSLAPA